VQPLFSEMLLRQDFLPHLHLRMRQLLLSWNDLHHDMMGMSHHTDPLKRSLNLCSSVKIITTFSEMAVQQHTLNSVSSPCYGSFSSHLTHKSCFVQILFSTALKIIRKYSFHISVAFLRH
jgi:hypothetical protein